MAHGRANSGAGEAPRGGILARGRDTFSVLGERNYRWYWLATFCYYTGMQMEMLARGWLAWELTESAWLFGWVILSQGAPSAVMTLLGGTLADRFPKRTMVMAAQVALALTGGILCLLIATGQIQWWHLAGIGLLKGVVSGFTMPARLSMVSDVVEESKFMRAYALYYMALNTMHVLGPSVAGAIIWATGGAAGAYLVITLAHLMGFLMLIPVRSLTDKPIAHRPSFLQGLGDTFGFAFRTPTILVLIGAELGIVFFSPATNFLPVFNANVFFPGGDPQTTAAGLAGLQVSEGVGGLVGSLIVASLAQTQRKPLALLISGVAQGVGLVLFASTGWFPLAVFFIGLEGITRACYTTLNSTLFQVSAPPEMRGRAISLYLMGNQLRPLGVLPVSASADAFGIQLTFMVAGSILVCYMVAVMLLFPTFRKQRI